MDFGHVPTIYILINRQTDDAGVTTAKSTLVTLSHRPLAMSKPAEEYIENKTFPEKSVDGLDQDALYQAYAAKDGEWHRKMTKQLLRKVDLHLLPFLVLMYLLNFLDRK